MVPRSTLFNELNYHLFTSQCVRLADFTTKLGSVVKSKQTYSSGCLGDARVHIQKEFEPFFVKEIRRVIE